MINLIKDVGQNELGMVNDCLSAILSNRVKFTEIGEKEELLDIIRGFLSAYPHRDERRETKYICRFQYQKLINSGIVSDIEKQRRQIQ